MNGDTLDNPGFRLSAIHHHVDREDEVRFGFWVFLMSDAIIFGLIFATYATMIGATAGGPGPKKLFDIGSVAIETGALLLSSFTFGMASLALLYRSGRGVVIAWLVVTLLLGLVFLGFEVHDFLTMFALGGSPDRSGFTSAFFALVPLHGLHVTTGCIWMVVLIGQMLRYGTDEDVRLGVQRLALFWHFLDIVWIAIFSLVYLGGLA
ncbi:MAG TPA: cytochrome c oxidase subunit 3 [Acetobacteraceae bacterium]|nr:cytochrome c oxidase subunit 3 [Acetobacteraceae bacterium]